MALTTRAEREAALRKAGYNLFNIPADMVTVDLLSDSGTGAISIEQQAAMARGDESYAGARSFRRFYDTIRDLTGYEYILPTHQGRAAEQILFSVVAGPGKVVPSNALFDTTRANIEATTAEGLDLPCPESEDLESDYPFKGNADLGRLEALLRERAADVPMVVITVTNNTVAGQPVSLENLYSVRRLCDAFKVPLFLDAARFAENACLVKQREPGQGERSTRAIAEEFFGAADGAVMSAKKDAIAPIGGFMATNDEGLAAKARELLILGEGFSTYGGMAGHDMEVVSAGLQEVTDEAYLAHRIASVASLAGNLREAGVPVVWPPGGHAVYLDVKRFVTHIPPHLYPGHSLACAIYLVSGIRACELGSLAFGKTDPETGELIPAPRELVRLALPRRVYSQSHMDWVAEVLERVGAAIESLQGLRMTYEPPALRHFTARFEPESPARPLIGEV